MKGDGKRWRRSMLVAYLLWFFLGAIGAHRFYLLRIGSGLLMLALTAIGVYFWQDGGVLAVPCLALWLIIDAIILPGMVRNPPGWRRGLGTQSLDPNNMTSLGAANPIIRGMFSMGPKDKE